MSVPSRRLWQIFHKRLLMATWRLMPVRHICSIFEGSTHESPPWKTQDTASTILVRYQIPRWLNPLYFSIQLKVASHYSGIPKLHHNVRVVPFASHQCFPGSCRFRNENCFHMREATTYSGNITFDKYTLNKYGEEGHGSSKVRKSVLISPE